MAILFVYPIDKLFIFATILFSNGDRLTNNIKTSFVQITKNTHTTYRDITTTVLY